MDKSQIHPEKVSFANAGVVDRHICYRGRQIVSVQVLDVLGLGKCLVGGLEVWPS